MNLIKKKISVLTASSDFTLSKKARRNAKLYPYDILSDEHKEWVLEKFIYLRENMTESEIIFEQHLVRHHIEYEKQVFFRIDGNDYFLDFYFPRLKIAVEIDGGIHKSQKDYDKIRDANFRKIGIRTIRVKNRQVFNNDVISCLQKQFRIKTSTNFFNSK